jgi:hypothetical protein
MNMKKREFRIPTLVVLVLAFMFISVQAMQMVSRVILTADIPFSFTVENTMLPAGNYEIEQVGENELSIYNPAVEVRANVLTENANATEAMQSSDLIFNEYEGKYFLSKIWVQGSDEGFVIPKGRSEMMMAGQPNIKKVKGYKK